MNRDKCTLPVDLNKLAVVLDGIREDVCEGSDGNGYALERALCMLADISLHLKGIPYHAGFDFDISA